MKISKEKGITLIALIITIIVLLILAGVSIAMVVGDNGVLGQAVNAVEATNISGIKEKIELAVVGAYTDGEGDLTTSNLRKELDNYFDDYSLTGTKTKGWKVTVDRYIYEIDPNGSVEYAGEKVVVATTPVYVKLYSQSDGSYALVFSNSDSEYEESGFTLEDDYGDIVDMDFNNDCPPWFGDSWDNYDFTLSTLITTVIIADEIVPKNTTGWFYNLYELTSIENIENLNTSNVTSMYWMFEYCEKLESLDLSNFDTSNVTNMSWMFSYCYALTSLDVSSFDTSNVTDMSYMFYYCYSLESLDVSGFDTSEVTDMSFMFAECSGLEILDLCEFDTSQVTDMRYMFYSHDGNSLSFLDVSRFNTSNVTDMSGMFCGCKKIISLDLSSFNTSMVTNMSYMFHKCLNLVDLDLSRFNTSNVQNMRQMFYHCDKLVTIFASYEWSIGSVTDSTSMFASCPSLVGAISYDSSKTDATYANYETGYFTYKASSN